MGYWFPVNYLLRHVGILNKESARNVAVISHAALNQAVPRTAINTLHSHQIFTVEVCPLLKNKNCSWQRKKMKNTTRISDNSSSTKLRGIQGSFTQSSSFPDVWVRDSSTSFPAVYSHSFFALLKPQTIPPPPPTPSGPDSSSVTTLRGVERTVMPLNFPLGNRSSEDLSFRPIQKRPIWKGAKPSLRRSEGCLQNNSLLSAVRFPEESPPQTDNSLQIGARVWPIGV